jgi:mono/diheme cytochrome c family protein
MSRGWRPLVVGAAIVVATFALAQAEVFAPSAPAGDAAAGEAARGEAIFASKCSSCHGTGGAGGGVGPALAGTGLDAATVTAVVQQGRGVMPAGIVSGQEQADVAAYVVSISSPAQ